jgi:hypothetical protein
LSKQSPDPIEIVSILASLLGTYTARQMTFDGDSLNGFLGVISMLEKTAFPAGFNQGLPLTDYPEMLGWIHGEQVLPKRRPLFPSWSWAGWEGAIRFPDGLLPESLIDEQLDPWIHMKPAVHATDGGKLTLKGWLVTLEISTEPFSEVLLPGSNESFGSVRERDFLHNNTISTGQYDCLVLKRVVPKRSGFQKVFLVILEKESHGQATRRKTLITVISFKKSYDFLELRPVEGIVTLE